MLVNFYQTTRLKKPEDNYLHTCHHENLKSHLHFNPAIDKKSFSVLKAYVTNTETLAQTAQFIFVQSQGLRGLLS
jgi:hypothetical protein